MNKDLLHPRPSNLPRLAALGAAVAFLLVVGYAAYYAYRLPGTRSQKVTSLAYEQEGGFDYVVHLKPNSIYDSAELGPGSTYFTGLSQSMGVSFAYRLQSAQIQGAAPLEYEVFARLEEPGLWSKEYVLVPLSQADGSVATSFTVPIALYRDTLDAIQKETGSGRGPARVVVEARVQPGVTTAFGSISAPFTQTLAMDLGADTFKVTGDLDLRKPGAITRTQVISVPEVDLYRKLSAGGLVLALALAAAMAWSYYRAHRNPLTPDEVVALAGSVYKPHLVWVTNLPARDAQTVVHVKTLPDLARAAEELMKPMLVMELSKGYLFAVIDSADRLRYEYLVVPQAESAQEQVTSTAGQPV